MNTDVWSMIDQLPAAVVAYLFVLRPFHRQLLERLEEIEDAHRLLVRELRITGVVGGGDDDDDDRTGRYALH